MLAAVHEPGDRYVKQRLRQDRRPDIILRLGPIPCPGPRGHIPVPVIFIIPIVAYHLPGAGAQVGFFRHSRRRVYVTALVPANVIVIESLEITSDVVLPVLRRVFVYNIRTPVIDISRSERRCARVPIRSRPGSHMIEGVIVIKLSQLLGFGATQSSRRPGPSISYTPEVVVRDRAIQGSGVYPLNSIEPTVHAVIVGHAELALVVYAGYEHSRVELRLDRVIPVAVRHPLRGPPRPVLDVRNVVGHPVARRPRHPRDHPGFVKCVVHGVARRGLYLLQTSSQIVLVADRERVLVRLPRSLIMVT